MNNKWSYRSTKSLLVFWIVWLVIGSGTFIFIKQYLGYVPFTSLIGSIVPFIVIAIIVIVALLYLEQGIKGLVTGKASGLGPKFSKEYRMERGRIGMRYKEHQGILGLLRSLISIFLAAVILLIFGLIVIILYQIYRPT